MRNFINRLFAILILTITAPLIIIIYFLIYLNDGLPVLFTQDRIGRNNIKFKVFKFRTMKNNTPDIATHLMDAPDKFQTKLGPYFRKLSIDELPQLINIIKGDMLFVGPRPALHNQRDLIKLRTDKKIHKLTPGITGWAQVNGRDRLSIQEKVKFDEYYLYHKSLLLDLIIIFKTIIQIFYQKNVTH